MSEERPSHARGGRARVLTVDVPPGTSGGLESADDLAVTPAPDTQTARERIAEGAVDCLVCGPDAEQLLNAAAEESTPAVACVPDAAAAKAALSAGATETYRHDGRVDGELLAVRVRSAVGLPAPDGDGTAPPEGGEAVLSRVREGFLAVDADWRVTRANRTAAELFERPRERLLGADLREAFPGGVDPDAFEDLEHAMETGKAVSFEQFCPPLSRWLELSAYPNPVGLSLYLRDVTERKRRERELREYETVVETIPDGAWVLDADGRFVAVNDEMASMTGHERSELLDRHVSLILEDTEFQGQLLGESDAEPTTVETGVETADGDRLPCEIRVRNLTEDGEFRGTVGIVRDLSDQRRRERRLRRLVGATQYLMAADSPESVMRTASRAATEVLGFPGTGFRRYDSEAGVLESVALGGNVQDIDGRPPYPVDDSPHGRAFLSGETVVESPDDEDDPYDREVFSQTMYVPVGEYGLLSAGLTEGTFDETDRQFAELLAASAEAALDRAERQQRLLQYEGVVEQAAGMVFALDTDDRFTVVSESLADRLGYDRENLLGRPVTSVLDDAVGGTPGLTWELRSDPGGRQSFETAMVTADGDRVPVEVEVSLLTRADDAVRGTVGTIRDITELERTRERLADQRHRFTYLFENLPDAVAEVDFVGQQATVRSVNGTFRETFAPDVEEFDGQPLDEFVLPPGLREEGKRLNERAAAGEAIETNVRRLSTEGTRHFLLRVVPYDMTAERTRSFTIYTDITEQKQRERYLRVVNRVLRHNLRNDLNVVQGYAERLLAEVDDPALREYARTVRNTVDRIALQSEAAREIQDAIRQDQGQLEPVDLAVATEQVAAGFRERYPGADVETDLPDTAVVQAGTKLELVVDNLVENAIVHNTGDRARVRVTVETTDEQAILRVVDDGPGIPESERAVVAEDREITQLEHGSGLGLWVVKWLVENYGGRIEFVDGELGGAGVEVRLQRSTDRRPSS